MENREGNSFLWVERYRPQTIADTILPPRLKQAFESIVETGEIPNMIFTGTAGLGKTTVAKALCNTLQLDYIVINGSEQGNIDTLRGKIRQFASTVSMTGGHKVVILDEADYLNPQSTQPALRGFIEEFSDNCRFILTCNFKNKIIDPLHSRCAVYEFNTDRKELASLCHQFMLRLIQILLENNIQFDEQIVANLIMNHAPDWRRVLNEAQRHAAVGGLLNAGVLAQGDNPIDELVVLLKEKQFNKMRKWVVDHSDLDSASVFRGLYDRVSARVQQQSIPQLVLILADYQYKNAFVADHELNLVACLTEVMHQVEFI